MKSSIPLQSQSLIGLKGLASTGGAFIRQFLTRPAEVGSLFPSTTSLGNEMLRGLSLDDFQVVIEYGPGTGAFTEIVNRHLQASCRYYAVEPNPHFQKIIRKKFPDIYLVSDYADQLRNYIPEYFYRADCVISGLPFSVMDDGILETTLDETYDVLRPGGYFRTFIYQHTYCLPKISRMRAKLERQYAEVSSWSVFRNFPPAIIISCRK